MQFNCMQPQFYNWIFSSKNLFIGSYSNPWHNYRNNNFPSLIQFMFIDLMSQCILKSI